MKKRQLKEQFKIFTENQLNNMQYIVPQFIEKETKIFGPFTFKEIMIVGVVGGFLIFLYFLVDFSIFVLATIILGGGSLLLLFYKVEGFPLFTIAGRFFVFLSQSKIYIWKKKSFLTKIFKKEETKKEEKEYKKSLKSLVLSVEGKNYLRKLSIFLETENK